MTDNTKVRSDGIAAKATKLAGKVGFGYRQIHSTELPPLYEQLMVTADCSHSTAVRHIKATLGLTEPIGRLRIAFPVQRFNYRATDKETETIKPKLKEYIKEMLKELRND